MAISLEAIKNNLMQPIIKRYMDRIGKRKVMPEFEIVPEGWSTQIKNNYII